MLKLESDRDYVMRVARQNASNMRRLGITDAIGWAEDWTAAFLERAYPVALRLDCAAPATARELLATAL